MEENLSNGDLIVDHDYEMLGEINEESCSSEMIVTPIRIVTIKKFKVAVPNR